MARNTVSISTIVNDFIILNEENDYTTHASDVSIKNFALRGIRDMGFDFSRRIKSIKLPMNTTNNTVELPDDFVGLNKIGIVGSDGKVYVFSENNNINYSMTYVDSSDNSTTDSSSAVDSDNDGVFDRVDSKTTTSGTEISSDSDYATYVFSNYIYGDNQGQLYGIGGGHKLGQYRLNLDQNRIELDTKSSYTEFVIEYVADEARAKNPSVHVFQEEALMAYIYYRLVERKSNVPLSEKQRARAEYYNERRKANARLSTFTKEEALQVTRKNFKLSTKV
tara:strand:- start:11160 stop:11996 length:837 start_codon:yes stop_codon:yes gene_type:complete